MFPFSVDNINMGISDHNAIFIHIEVGAFDEVHSNKSIIFKRVYNEENIEYFKFLLQKENWSSIISKSDVNAKSVDFINSITHYFNIAFPIKKQVISPNHHNKHKQKSWITKGIIISCKRKRQLYNMCQITNNHNLKQHYKKYTNILRKVIYEAKLKCNSNFIMTAENKGKAIWDVVKRETGKNSCTPNTNHEFEICSDGQIFRNSSDIAEMFNNYFSNVTKNLEISQSIIPQPRVGLPENNNTIFLTPVTADEIPALKIINSL